MPVCLHVCGQQQMLEAVTIMYYPPLLICFAIGHGVPGVTGSFLYHELLK